MLPGLRPVFALFIRALRDDVRAKFPPILRALVLLLLLSLLWMNQSMLDVLNAGGQFLLGTLATLNFVGITLLGLATFCSAITEEKEDGTLALLRMTRLNPLAILLGKSTARLTGGLLFLAVQVPFTLLCVTLGGVSVMQIITIYAILAGYLFFLCNLGLLFSVIYRTTTRAVVTTLFLGGCIFLLAPAIWHGRYATDPTTHGDLGGLTVALTGYLTTVNPVSDLFNVLNGGTIEFESASLSFLLSAGAICFGLGWALFEKFCGGELVEALPPRRKGARSGRGRGGRVWRVPLAWKDFHFAIGGWRGVALRAILYATALGVCYWVGHTHFQSRDWRREFTPVILFCAALGFILEVVISAASVFGRERKQHTLGTLWVLPISTTRWIWGKVGGYALGLLFSVSLWGAARILHLEEPLRSAPSPSVYYNDAGREAMQAAMVIYFLVQVFFFPILIAYFSLLLRRGALVIGLAAFLFWNFLAYILQNIFARSAWSTGGINDFYSRFTIMFWCLSLSLVAVGIVLALLIPRRLEACAAED